MELIILDLRAIIISLQVNNLSLNSSQVNVGCNGNSDGSIDLTVNNGSGSYTYSWDNGSTSEDLSSLTAGTYTVTVTDNNWGCVETYSVTITEPASAFSVGVSSIGSATVCSGSTVTLNMSTYASAVNTYQWNDANGIISGEVTSTYIATVSGTYSLTVTTPAGCSATSSGLVVNIIDIAVPSGLFTDNIQLNKGTMNWSAVADAHHYDVRFREQGTSSWQILYASANSITKSGLASTTTYEWEVRSSCSAGNNGSVSAWSSTQNFTTLTPCTAPSKSSYNRYRFNGSYIDLGCSTKCMGI